MTPSASVVAAAVDLAADADGTGVNAVTAVQQQNGTACRRIQVSREKRPVHFFVALAKKFLNSDTQIELSGLGLAVVNVVTIAELLRQANIATVDGTSLQILPISPHHASVHSPEADLLCCARASVRRDSNVVGGAHKGAFILPEGKDPDMAHSHRATSQRRKLR
ncbi:DNA/RNA-binding protein Alba [Gracilaria domingensis]|nr:DNA/RNA-binding protein Alba [Gracilaria domingensis]